MNFQNDNQLRRSGTTRNEKKEKSSLFSNIIKSITRSKTPKQTKERNETFSIFMKNKSAVIPKKPKLQIDVPTQQLKNCSEMNPSKNQNQKEEYFNQFHNNENHKKPNSEIVTPCYRKTKDFDPYSQQTVLVDFLKREQIYSNGHVYNKQKNNIVKDEQIKIQQKDKEPYNDQVLQLNKYNPPTDLTQNLKQSKIKRGVNDISSLDMLADQTMVIDSNANRQINPDISLKPVLYVETLESQVWIDDVDLSQNIGYYTQTDEENRKKQRSLNTSHQYQIHDKSIQRDKRSDKFEQKSSKQNNDIPNQQYIQQNGKDISSEDRDSDNFTIEKQQKIDNISQNSQEEIYLDQYYNPYNQNKKPHLLKDIPLFISSDNNSGSFHNKLTTVNNDTQQQNTFFVKTTFIEQTQLEKQNKFQEEITLINKSIIKGVDKHFDIKVILTEMQKDNQQIVNIMLDQSSLNHLQIVSNLYNSQSRCIPDFNFTDLSLQFTDQNSSTINKDTLINVYQLKDSAQELTYNFFRFQNFDECSQIFQNVLLQKLVQDQIGIPSLQQKNIYLFQNKSDDVYILQEIEEYITLSEIINFSNQKNLLLKKLKNDQLLQLFLDVLNIYDVFYTNKIALPCLSVDTIAIYYDSVALSFINLQNCYSLENFSEVQINQIRSQEREQLINILNKLQKNLEVNKTEFGVGSSTLIPLNVKENVDNQQYFYEQIFDQLKNGNFQMCIENIQKQIQITNQSYNNYNNQIQNQIIGNNSQKQNTSITQPQMQKSNQFQSQLNNSNNQTCEEFKKKRKHLSQYIIAHKNQMRTKKIRSENSNFQKCQKLTYLSQIYNSIFMKKQSLKTLEDLKNLKAECYGVDSEEYLKTLQNLCKIYYQQMMFSQLVLNIETYTEYLRNQFKPAFANELFHMCKVKLKMTKSQTISDDILTLIAFLKSQNSKSTSSQKANENKYQFSLSKLYYQLGSCYNQIDEFDLALQNFKKCITYLSIEDNQNMNTKLQFYSLSNLARIYYKQKNNEEAKKILRNLQKSPIKFAYPIYYQYLGQIEFEDKNYEQSFQYLHQCYILREKDPKCNRDYLELLLHYILVSFKIYGSQSDKFKKLCNEMKNFTGDYYNLDCLLIICNLLFEEKHYNLSQQKYEQAKGIMNLLIFSEKNNKTLFKEYKKRMTALEEKLQKVQSHTRSTQAR